ncbi:hypothetical protein tb265_36440 [Gemmatimonadetes bacterium T265]|nr:hypothetical protein tb265_36440 [Gemmatimonadetes bacterium T265]
MWRALREPSHYRAAANMLRRYPRPVDAVARYVFGRGAYPANVAVRTPVGRVSPRLYAPDDMLTLNEVFCRLDYALDEPARVVVDLGSNIGLSALYFLTRASRPFCHLYEPDPRNASRLRDNLERFGGRWELAEAAVAPRAGRVRFATEPTGRYGRVGDAPSDAAITVDCLAINDVLDRALSRTGTIDLVKIDTEGLELATVRAMDPTLLRRVRAIVFEAFDEKPDGPLHPALFTQQLRGSVCRLTRRRD